MATFHISVIQPLTDLYAHWALGALSSSPEAVPLSRVDVACIQRAIYRLQTICNYRIGSRAALLGLLDAFSPWESEKILCVHAFAEEKCTGAFIMAAWDLNQDRNPRYRSISIFDTNEASLLHENGSKSISSFRIPVRLLIHFPGVINGNSLVSLLCQGPQVLIELFNAKDSEELAEVIENRVCYSIYEDNWINAAGKHSSVNHMPYLDRWEHKEIKTKKGEAISNSSTTVGNSLLQQDDRRDTAYTWHDEAQGRRQRMTFGQDSLASPLVAWVRFWNGSYCNLIGAYIPDSLAIRNVERQAVEGFRGN